MPVQSERFCARFKHCLDSMKRFFALATLICASASAAVASAPQLLIPAAGSTPGANGTFFRSDITLGNFASHDQVVRLQWLPQGATSTFSTTITFRANTGLRSADFAKEYLGRSGLGAIVVTGVTSTWDFDPTAALYANSRIWSAQAATGGT